MEINNRIKVYYSLLQLKNMTCFGLTTNKGDLICFGGKK